MRNYTYSALRMIQKDSLCLTIFPSKLQALARTRDSGCFNKRKSTPVILRENTNTIILPPNTYMYVFIYARLLKLEIYSNQCIPGNTFCVKLSTLMD